MTIAHVFFGVNQLKRSSRDVVFFKKLFLNAFILNQTDYPGLRINVFAFFFQLFQCFNIYFFYFNSNDVCFLTEIIHGVEVSDRTTFKVVCEVFTWSVCIRI
ncbi:hypothetical protein D3C71_1860600 [compost metagenome]